MINERIGESMGHVDDRVISSYPSATSVDCEYVVNCHLMATKIEHLAAWKARAHVAGTEYAADLKLKGTYIITYYAESCSTKLLQLQICLRKLFWQLQYT